MVTLFLEENGSSKEVLTTDVPININELFPWVVELKSISTKNPKADIRIEHEGQIIYDGQVGGTDKLVNDVAVSLVKPAPYQEFVWNHKQEAIISTSGDHGKSEIIVDGVGGTKIKGSGGGDIVFGNGGIDTLDLTGIHSNSLTFSTTESNGKLITHTSGHTIEINEVEVVATSDQVIDVALIA